MYSAMEDMKQVGKITFQKSVSIRSTGSTRIVGRKRAVVEIAIIAIAFMIGITCSFILGILLMETVFL